MRPLGQVGKVPRVACFELHTLKFIAEGAIALIVAYQALLAGHDVCYLEDDTEFARYALGNATERIGLLKEWMEPDLLVLDDLFLARRISEHAAEALAIVHQRYKLRRAIVVTSNRVVQDWGAAWGAPQWPPPS